MKRYLYFFFIFLTSVSLFFSFNRNVKADTTNYYLYDDTDFTIIDKWESCKSNLESYLTSNNYSLHYYVYFYGAQYYDEYFHVFIANQQSWNNLSYMNNNALIISNSSSWSKVVVNISTCSVSSSSYNSRYLNAPIYYNSLNYSSNFPQYVIFSTDNIYFYYNVCLNSADSITYNYSDKTYEASCSTENHLFTLSELNTIWNSVPPTPPDNTPLLTDFYSLIVDKLSLLTNYFYTNTYLLAIPIIPILLLILYFIRRSIIK